MFQQHLIITLKISTTQQVLLTLSNQGENFSIYFKTLEAFFEAPREDLVLMQLN
jgi:hypothetical protein